MKFITVTGIRLQFDEFNPTMSKEEQTKNIIDGINVLLSDQYSYTQPQIQLSETSEIIVIEPKENEE